MSVALQDEHRIPHLPRSVMRANVFRSAGHFGLEEKPVPRAGPGEAVMQVRLTTICETDLHIAKGEYRVAAGLTLGHEAVGVIHELGVGVTGYQAGQRVVVGAITPCGQCESCLGGHTSQCSSQGGRTLGGWRLGNTIDGTQADFVVIPHAQANLAVIPPSLSDEQVLLLTHIASAGFASAANIKLGDAVAVFVHGPVGLCAAMGARLRGAAEIIAVDRDADRLALTRQYGATMTIEAGQDPVERIHSITDGRGVDVACVDMSADASSDRSATRSGYEDFESALRALRPGGMLLSVGVSCGHFKVPPDLSGTASEATRGAGRKEQTIATTLCPGGRERMARLMRLVGAHRVDLSPLVTHLFTLDEIVEAYELIESHPKGVLKVGIRVS